MVSIDGNESNSTLFKKILFSLFPKNIVNSSSPIQPIGMFISFISAKQFFSLINRKIIENYKLNLFDIALDPFEVKIGFGDKPMIKIKDIESYYAYCASANFNGNKFYNPSNLANIITIFASIYFHDQFEEDDAIHFTQLMLSIYLFTFVMYARIKTFTETDKKEKKFTRFVTTFFHFYQVIATKTSKPIKEKHLEEIKKTLLKKIDVRFCLFAFYARVNEILKSNFISTRECHARLLYDEQKKPSHKNIIAEYLKNSSELCKLPIFHPTEIVVIDSILPIDILVKYVFNAKDGILASRVLFSGMYDKAKCDEMVKSFLTNDDRLEELIQYLFSFKVIRDNFFPNMQKFLFQKHKLETKYNYKEEEEINEFMSAIENIDNIEDIKNLPPIPNKLMHETQTVEKLLNFYISFLGGFNISRGDTGFIKLRRKSILTELIKEENLIGEQENSIHYFGGLLYLYSKNAFYYKYAYDNVKAGKEKFSLPFRTSMKDVYSNMFLIYLFDEYFVATLLSDAVPGEIKIHIKTKKIIDACRERFGNTIKELVNTEQMVFIQKVYEPINNLLRPRTPFTATVSKYLTKEDVYRIKNRLYTLDFRIFRECCIAIKDYIVELQAGYSDVVIMGILASLKETLFGFLLYLTFLKEKKETPHHLLDILTKIYCTNILIVADQYLPTFQKIVLSIHQQYNDILNEWIKLDDNPTFFECTYENLLAFTKDKTLQELMEDISGEDMVWRRGYLKNATYYNRRYIIPE